MDADDFSAVGRPDTGATSVGKGVFSCVVDAKPRFHLEVLRWYSTLTRCAAVSPEDMVVHAVSRTHSDVLDYLAAQGVVIEKIDPFDHRSAPCNKIAGALSLADRGVEGMAVLTDTDVVILDDPRRIELGTSKIGLRIAGGPNPTLPVFERIFEAAGLEPPGLVPFDWRPGEFTLATHGNGGLYLVPAPILSRLAEAWKRWSQWLLGHGELLDRWTWFTDQIGFTLAMADEKVEAERLDIKWNYAWGKAKRSPYDVSPAVIHYHRFVTSEGLLKRTGVDAADRQIDIANSAITDVWREASPNSSFWDWRSQTDADAGSDASSPGRPSEAKQNFVSAVARTLRRRGRKGLRRDGTEEHRTQ